MAACTISWDIESTRSEGFGYCIAAEAPEPVWIPGFPFGDDKDSDGMIDPVIYERLNTAFRDVFDEDDIEVTAGTTAKDIEGWDSLSHIQLILAVSRAFSVSFSASEIGRLKTVGELVALIRAKTDAKADAKAEDHAR